jgi:uncharacterized protein YciI
MKQLLLSLLITLSFITPNTEAQEKKMPQKIFQTVELQGGPSWKKDLPPEQQDLSGHFSKIKELFDHHNLVGNGPLVETFHGFYLYQEADLEKVETLIQMDYGIKNKVLTLVEALPWYVVIDNSKANLAGKTLVILNYSADATYELGKDMEHQNAKLMKSHMEYVGSVAQKGGIFMGGPVDPKIGRGRYILIVDSTEEADRFIKNDPAIQARLFKAEMLTWKPFQIQATK